MDHSRFDDITKTLATPSRRSLLSFAGAAALAALLGWDETAAKRRKKKKKKNGPSPGPGPEPECVIDNDCCPDSRPTCDTDDTVYGIFRRCENGVCRCPKTVENRPRYLCATTGASFPDCRDCCDSAHCVADGAADAEGRTWCYPGSRTCQCPEETPNRCRVFGSNPLRYECTNVNSDPTNCGGCGNPPCNAQIGETCVNGVCRNPGAP